MFITITHHLIGDIMKKFISSNRNSLMSLEKYQVFMWFYAE